jgi:hypothetical protein
VRGLDDPENPYRDDYKAWDLWIYMHELTVLEAQGISNPGIGRDGWNYYSMSVDENGFPVPRLMATRDRYERLKHGSDANTEAGRCTHSIQAMGAMDFDMQHRMQLAEDAVLGEYLPEIPQWLVRGAPEWAMILPDGEVVTRGPVGSMEQLAPAAAADQFECYYRYSPEGVLVDKTELGQLWLQLFWDADRVIAKYNSDKVYFVDRNGYLVVISTDTRKTAALYDLDGSRLNTSHPLDDRDGTRFYKIRGDELLRAFKAQQQAQGRST